MYDLLIKGGKVLDPSLNLQADLDVAVTNGLIDRVEANIPETEAKRVIRVPGKLVVPGLIDMHVHVYDAVNHRGLPPNIAGVHAGVTTVVDGGSAGPYNFGGFPKYIIPNSETEILCFLHVVRNGLSSLPEIRTADDIDPDYALEVAGSNRQHIHGIKVRLVNPGLDNMGFELARTAKSIAKQAGLPIMVHIGDPHGSKDKPSVIPDLMNLLDDGDILTHLFTGHVGGVLDNNGKIFPEVKEARDRGVAMDTGHGRFNFSFNVASRLLDQGMRPHCISTDLTIPGRALKAFSMVETMTRFLALGFSLEEVVAMSTINPARILHLDDHLGSLKPGMQADISVLTLEQGQWKVVDSHDAARTVDKALAPVVTVKKGAVFGPEWGPHPWGWLPGPA